MCVPPQPTGVHHGYQGSSPARPRQCSSQLPPTVNLFDSEWREAQSASATRLRNECLTAGSPGCNPPADGARFGAVDDIHFTPGTPFSLQGHVWVYLPE